MKWLRVTAFLSALFCIPHYAAIADDDTTTEYPEIINAMQGGSVIKTEPLPNFFTAYFREIPRMQRMSYKEILQRYRATQKQLRLAFPELGDLDLDTGPLEAFSGTKKLVDPEVYGAPFLLITPRSLAGPDSRAFKRMLRVGNRSIPILYITTKVRKDAYAGGGKAIHEQYIASLNARIFGFSKAQAIQPLLLHATPASQFGYNGIRDWSSHQRYRRFDQVKRPIALTNFAHTNGDLYSISAHPDFALFLDDFRRNPIVLTFFLWKDTPSSTPDLIFQIEFKPRAH